MRFIALNIFLFLLGNSESHCSSPEPKRPSWVKSTDEQDVVSQRRVEELNKVEQKSRTRSTSPLWSPPPKEQDLLSSRRMEQVNTLEKNKVTPTSSSSEVPSSSLKVSSSQPIKMGTKRDLFNHLSLKEHNLFIKRVISLKGRNIFSTEEGEPIFVFKPEGQQDLYALGYSDKMDEELEKIKIGDEVTAYVALHEENLEESEIVSINQPPENYYFYEEFPDGLMSKVVEIKGVNVFSTEEKENIFMFKPKKQEISIPLGYAQRIKEKMAKTESNKEITSYLALNRATPEKSEIISVNKIPSGYTRFLDFKKIVEYENHVKYSDIVSSIMRHLTPLKSVSVTGPRSKGMACSEIQQKQIMDELKRMEKNIMDSIQSLRKN